MMKTLLSALVLLLAVSGGACTQKSGSVRDVTPSEAQGLLRNQFAVIVDVREAHELQGGMAEGALWIPFSEFEKNSEQWKEFVANLPKDKQILTYCAGGRRAGKVAEQLAKLGFQTGNLGGFDDLKAANMPIAKAPAPATE